MHRRTMESRHQSPLLTMSPPSSCRTKNPMTSQDTLQVIQTNLQKSKLGQHEVSRKINRLNKNNVPFLYFVQEPMVVNGRPAWQPNSCKRFGVAIKPRTLIYTDMNSKAWYIESLSSPDITCLLYTSPSPRDRQKSRMPSSA